MDYAVRRYDRDQQQESTRQRLTAAANIISTTVARDSPNVPPSALLSELAKSADARLQIMDEHGVLIGDSGGDSGAQWTYSLTLKCAQR